jgi:hypothetical protein
MSSTDNILKFEIKELDLDTIRPSVNTPKEIEKGGSKIFVIGKPGTGKTTLIASIMYHKRDVIPIAMIQSGSEDSNHFYKSFIPNTFIYNEYNEEKLANYIQRQKIARQHIENPWGLCLLDDCTDDPRLFNKPIMQGSVFKKGRHLNTLFIISLQYALDVRPVIRVNIDGTFILRESSLKIRKTIWENYASIIPDFSVFCSIMDQITDDYTALYIHNATTSNNISDCVFYYKATPITKEFKFGHPDFWAFHYDRYNEEYVDPVV